MPRAGLSAAVIVDEAARLADEVGRERLTLAALAHHFGVAQPSLYKHVAGLDALQLLVTVQVTREFTDTLRRAATGKSSGDALRAVAQAYRRYALAHPGRYGYLHRAPRAGDREHEAAASDLLALLTDVLRGYGIAGSDAIDAVRFLRSALHGFVALELAGGFAMPHPPTESFERLVSASHRALEDW